MIRCILVHFNATFFTLGEIFSDYKRWHEKVVFYDTKNGKC